MSVYLKVHESFKMKPRFLLFLNLDVLISHLRFIVVCCVLQAFVSLHNIFGRSPLKASITNKLPLEIVPCVINFIRAEK